MNISYQRVMFAAVLVLLIIGFFLTGCVPFWSQTEVTYIPQDRGDWLVSTPGKEGLEPNLVGRLYRDAEKLDTLYGLLVIKNGKLVAEQYFNSSSIDDRVYLASVTKSFTSALVGIALEQECIPNLDVRLVDFFPEYADQLEDPRKGDTVSYTHLRAHET